MNVYKNIFILIIIALILSFNATFAEDVTIELPERGIIYKLPSEYLDKGLTVDGSHYNDSDHPTATVNFSSPTVKENPKGDKNLGAITLVDEKEFTGLKAKDFPQITGYDDNRVMGINDGCVYLCSIAEKDIEGMSDEERELYESCRDYLPQFMSDIRFCPIQWESDTLDETDEIDKDDESNADDGEPTEEVFPAFNTKDLDGKKVSDDIFADYDLTVVNLWGTFCSACIKEMPDLGQWAQNLPKGVNLVGVVTDVVNAKDKRFAREIVEKTGADFQHIISNDDFSAMLKGVFAYPTTLFVDRDGHLVGEPIVGANVKGYKARVTDFLNQSAH